MEIATSKEIINYNIWSLVLGSLEAAAVRVVVEYRVAELPCLPVHRLILMMTLFNK